MVAAYHKPVADGILLNLKSIAACGKRLGTLFDRGVLAVVCRVEADGQFTPDPRVALVLLLALQEQGGAPVHAPFPPQGSPPASGEEHDFSVRAAPAFPAP